MTTIILQASSSEGPPYEVTFTEEVDSLRITCTCSAGEFHVLCKHRIELIAGDISRLHAKPPDSDWLAVQSLVTKYRLCDVMQRLQSAESALEVAKKQVKTVKREIGHGFDAGIRNLPLNDR